MMDILNITLSPCCDSEFSRKANSAVCLSCGKNYPFDGNCLKLFTKLNHGQHLKKNNELLKWAKFFLRPVIKAHENKLNDYYERSLTNQKLAEWFRNTYLPFVKPDDKLSVLDFGCGRGRMSALLSLLKYDVVGLDKECNDFWGRITQAQFVGLPYTNRLPFVDECFDLCLHYLVLGYLDSHLTNLKEMKRVLKRGGFIHIQVANKTNLYTLTTGKFVDPCYKLLSLEELKDLITMAGFELCSIDTERFYAPIFPQAINFIRFITLHKFDPFFDRDSVFVKLTPPKFRAVINILARA